MKIPVQMLNEHRYREDARSSRTLPRGWVGELDEEVAIGVIAANSARPLVALNADQKLAVDVVRASIAGDHEKVDSLLKQAAADAAEDGKAPGNEKPDVLIRAELKKVYEGPDDTGQPTKLNRGVRVEGEFAARLIAEGFAKEIKAA
jgi:hypothetical protein